MFVQKDDLSGGKYGRQKTNAKTHPKTQNHAYCAYCSSSSFFFVKNDAIPIVCAPVRHIHLSKLRFVYFFVFPFLPYAFLYCAWCNRIFQYFPFTYPLSIVQ